MCYGRNLTNGYFSGYHTACINTLGGLLSYPLEDKSRRAEMTMVLFYRLLESWGVYFTKRKISIESPYFTPTLCAASFGVISMIFGKEKEHMKTSFRQLFSFLWGTDEDYDFSKKLQLIKTESSSSVED